ncbi:LOW QUALITY PROTEIN: putative U-box domain-containing protein 50 [Magnolia sinica]|uniref:LOW QUALITY PROTEIN: putative U-box domain-containing protein 50 n=1 Tax=Magnolia sinica TaxID=86752 RepID=UPI002658B067|nr:LOW QUALITY PROTEIN: putative U-box domain-containing protein 50 [Magnolia sinica]
MEVQQEKIYVAIGKDVQEGLNTLEWTLKNWASQSLSIVILHVSSSSKDFVHTPFGKLPASSVSDEKLEVFRNHEMSPYKTFCGKVKMEVLRIEKSEEPMHNVIVGFISRLHVTKLVMSITCMKSSSRKGKSGISGTFYVHKHKPNYCELFITCGGKLVRLREENEEGYLEDEEGVVIADMRKKMKEKSSSRGWLEKMLPDNVASYVVRKSPGQTSSTQTGDIDEKSEDFSEEIEIYLRSLTLNSNAGEEDGTPPLSPEEKVESENINPNMRTPKRTGDLRAKLEKAKKMVEEKRNEIKLDIERRIRAERVISLCDRRAEKLEAHINEELAHQSILKKELDILREQLEEASNDILETENRRKSALELQRDLTNILHAHSSEKMSIEVRLEKALIARAEMIRELDEIRRQRDVLRRRIHFCRQRAPTSVSKVDEIRRQRDVLRRRIHFCRQRAPTSVSNSLNYSYTEFTLDELRAATDNFSDSVRVADGVYKGKLNHVMVAIRLENSLSLQSQEEFQDKMRLLCQIRHPNLITLVGACTTVHPMSTVFEYMHNRSLRDLLFCPTRCKAPLLPWPTRIRIASEICSALAFLHGTRPTSTPHTNLKLSNVLLDRALVAKIADLRVDPHRRSGEDLDRMIGSDVRDLGILMLQMLTGKEEVAVDEVLRANDGGGDLTVDERAGEWPLEVALGFGRLGVRCAHVSGGEWGMEMVVREIEEVRRKAEIWSRADRDADVAEVENCYDAPGVFLCPILQEVMKHPYLAADGFSYELEAIEEWLGSGHDTSPMTNLKLQNKLLTPNHTLRSLIQDWHNNRSRP